jgi:hypothetical protein
LSDAKIIEEKTSNPASFSQIGVDDPSSPGASGAEIGFTARDGQHTVIIGKPVGDGNFARRGGENRSYSVEPGITFETEPRYWIDTKLIDVAAAGIQSIQVKPSAGAAYSLHRDSANGGNFVLDGVPAGRKALDAASLAPSPTSYGALSADDVAPAGDIDFGKATLVTVTLADGNVISLTGATVGDKHWVQLQASKDAALNAKAGGRAFEIASYRFDAIFRPLEQLLVAKSPPAGDGKSAPPAGLPPKSSPARSSPPKPLPAASPVPAPKS